MKLLIPLLLLSVFIVGCNQVICNEPYIQVGLECCLDENANKICDKDEKIEEEVKIEVESKIPPKPIPKPEPIPEPKPEPIPEPVLPTLITTNEDYAHIDLVTVREACVQGLNGGEIYFRVGTVPDSITFQVKEEAEFVDMYTRSGLYDGYTYFSICNNCKHGAFQLKEDKIYVFRIKFDQTNVFNKIEYSNEHLIDTGASSTYMLKNC